MMFSDSKQNGISFNSFDNDSQSDSPVPIERNRDKPTVDRIVAIWGKITNRSKNSPKISQEQEDRLKDCIGRYENAHYVDIFPIVQAASVMYPIKNDYSDFERLIKVFSNSSYRDSAFEEIKLSGAKIIKYSEDRNNNLKFERILDDLGYDESDDEIDSIEYAALSSISNIDEDKYSAIISDLIDSNPSGLEILPSEFMKYVMDVRDSLTSKNPEPYDVADTVLENYGASGTVTFNGQSSYQSPSDISSPQRKNIEELLYSDDMSVDIIATKMIGDGVAVDDILSYHNQAPEGYWKDVIDLIENSDNMIPKEAYQTLKEKYDWYPTDRQKPIQL